MEEAPKDYPLPKSRPQQIDLDHCRACYIVTFFMGCAAGLVMGAWL